MNLRSRQAAFSFITLLSLTLVATTRIPEVGLAVDQLFNLPDVGRMIEYICLTIAAMAWALVCLDMTPHIAHRRWLLYLAPAVFLLIFGAWWLALISGQPIQHYLIRTNYNLAMTLIAHGYLFSVVTGFGIPAVIHNFNKETSPVLQLRIVALAGAHVFAAILSGIIIVLYSLVTFGVLPSNYESPFVMALMALTVLAYCIALLPKHALTHGSSIIGYLRDLTQLRRVRKLEAMTASLLGVPAKAVSLYDAFYAPDYALYTLAVAIFDRRKSLHDSDKLLAKHLASVLDKIATRASGYDDLVKQLQHAAL